MTGPVTIKICGVRDAAAARAAAEAGVDALGFVFADSPRRVTPDEARRIAADLPPEIERVAVFRSADADEVRRVLDLFPADRVQTEPTRALLAGPIADRLLPVLHDDGTLAEQTAALSPGRRVLLEAAGRGGRGTRPDWSRAAELAARRPLILAGGLDAGNVQAALRRVRPVGVDVSSGVEDSPGRKSAARIAAFVAAVRYHSLEEA
jgi:phosphoribosylanthranilate isomerase